MVKESGSRDGTVKKKKKTSSNQDNEPETDMYKKVVSFEEKEALRRSPEEDAQFYFNFCKNIRTNLADIAKLKSKKSDNSEKIEDLATECCLNIVGLKKLNRMEKVRLVVAKDAINTDKQKVDSINLQYQNLLYEAHHLISEATKCLQFKSKDEDIELVSVDDFMANAPDEVTSKFKNMDDSNDTLKHELRLARLEWELKQRKNLAALCKSMEEQKKKLGIEIVELRNRLDGLAPRLATVLEATKPLQEHLDLPIDKIRGEHQIASLLPSALYLFYANVDAYRQVFDIAMHVAIVGDKEEASQWNEPSNINYLLDEDEDEPETEVAEVEDGTEAQVKKRRHRKSVQADPLEEKKKRLLEVHPLAVEATTNVKDALSLTVKLHYYTNLKIVTCTSSVNISDKISANTAREVLTGESILSELLPGDSGLESPNPTNMYQLKKVGLGSYQSLVPQIGYAYRWAQKICGFDFLSKQVTKGSCDQLSQSSVESVMKSLKKRMEARYALATQLQQLEKHIVPELPAEVNCPKSHVAMLNKWSSSTYQQFCENACEDFIEGEYVQPQDMFYSGNINRATVNLQIKIAIKNDYPATPPIFLLCLNYQGCSHNATNNDDIRDMERSVNIGWKHGPASASWLLAAQITYLCSFLDVYLETKDPENFPQTTMFFRSVCARNRRRPFKFKKFGTGIFIQY